MNGLIGLEIHTYLVTKEKLFCRCAASREKGLKPNVNICPVCTGQPGAKPMAANAEAVHKAVMIARMLGCTVNERMRWMRKHYDWPDMPKGYQTTMSGAHATPLGINGNFGGIEVSSMHLEEDPASWDPSSGCVDYNRSGLPLVEIVTAPAFHYAEEVGEWLQNNK
jgi:aspartyl-tRNA(Asn)/glutamyl-tRNA(Gln) amidotransferase subunit B